ncbi:hypothetical protein [Peterkaempfera bronchialis]|uniref:hypothetical protein n=1 Tax=Peterkaempfera bronchialis TaxID=2126346 RepID=UPI001589419A|nr:hypothetical protein [Peterkaempfera bronchialis]
MEQSYGDDYGDDAGYVGDNGIYTGDHCDEGIGHGRGGAGGDESGHDAPYAAAAPGLLPPVPLSTGLASSGLGNEHAVLAIAALSLALGISVLAAVRRRRQRCHD